MKRTRAGVLLCSPFKGRGSFYPFFRDHCFAHCLGSSSFCLKCAENPAEALAGGGLQVNYKLNQLIKGQKN